MFKDLLYLSSTLPPGPPESGSSRLRRGLLSPAPQALKNQQLLCLGSFFPSQPRTRRSSTAVPALELEGQTGVSLSAWWDSDCGSIRPFIMGLCKMVAFLLNTLVRTGNGKIYHIFFHTVHPRIHAFFS